MTDQERTPRHFPGRGVAAALVLVSLLVAALPASPAPALVDASGEHVELGPASSVIEDREGRWSAADIWRGAASDRASPGASLTGIGFRKFPHWFRIEVNNPTAHPLQRLLVADPAWLDEVDLFVASSGGAMVEYHGGNHLPFSARAVPSARINLPLELPPGRSTLLVRVRSCGPVTVELGLWDREALLRTDVARAIYEGLTFGVVGVLLLFNVILWLAVREKVFGAYVVFLGAFMVMHGVYDGFAYQHLWPEQPAWNSWINSAMVYLFAAAGLRFAMVFLELKSKFRRLHQVAAGMIGAILVSLLLGTAYDGLRSDHFWFVWATGAPLFTFGVVILLLREGDRGARYYLAAMLCALLGSMVTALTVSGYLPFAGYTYEAVELGMVTGAVLLAAAIAERVLAERAAADMARKEALDSTRAHAKSLATEVARRTGELQAATAAKDKFFSIIAHDLRGPIHSLALLYKDVVTGPEQFSPEVLALTRTTTGEVSHLLEHLLLWARSQRGEIEYRPEWLDLTELLREIEGLDLADATAKGVVLRLVPDAPCPVFADREMARTILRNLIGNALKFTPGGGCVKASVASEGAYRAIRISDTGIGIDPPQQGALFQLHAPAGSKGRHGSGLGLILCREFVQRHGGSISVESRPGLGTSFTFTLPKVVPAGRTRPAE